MELPGTALILVLRLRPRRLPFPKRRRIIGWAAFCVCRPINFKESADTIQEVLSSLSLDRSVGCWLKKVVNWAHRSPQLQRQRFLEALDFVLNGGKRICHVWVRARYEYEERRATGTKHILHTVY